MGKLPSPATGKSSLPFALCSGKEDSLSRHSVATLYHEKESCAVKVGITGSPGP